MFSSFCLFRFLYLDYILSLKLVNVNAIFTNICDFYLTFSYACCTIYKRERFKEGYKCWNIK
nr:MAG TPA: hypothetical protein [Caudoviricetes sp.]